MHPFRRGDAGLNPATRRKLLERHPSLVLVVLFLIFTAFLTWREITQEFGFLTVRNQKAMAETQAEEIALAMNGCWRRQVPVQAHRY